MFRPPSIIASEENQFRSIVSLIHAKYNSAVSIYSSKLNTFFTISQTAPVFVIKNKAMELYMSEQMMVIFDEARSLSETVLDAYRCIFTNNPVPSFNDKWLRLCSLRSILEIPQLTCFCYEHKGDRVPQRSLLTLYDVGGTFEMLFRREQTTKVSSKEYSSFFLSNHHNKFKITNL